MKETPDGGSAYRLTSGWGSLMRAVMALSGGMDSTGLLMRLLADGYEVSCLSFDYGQKHSIELRGPRENIVTSRKMASMWII